MNIENLKEKLLKDESIINDAFEILKEISCFVNNKSYENEARELILRALEKRELFGVYQCILNDLTREVGLFPYLDKEILNFRDTIAYEYHKPSEDSDFVFHSEQAFIYRRIMAGESIVLSAPTSFGKSRIVDEVIIAKDYKNIALIVPTIALIDETRRRLSKFSDRYKIITQITQKAEDRNIFIFTAERINAYKELPQVDFFVIDEFYKISNLERDDERLVSLNYSFYKLHKMGGQFFLIGPSIESITEQVTTRCRCHFYKTPFLTVVSDTYNIKGGDKKETLLTLCQELKEPTIIYCNSPKKVNEIANLLCDEFADETQDEQLLSCVDWIDENYHADWVFGKAIGKGIGIHHAGIPRSLGQYVVRKFNECKLNFLICTSTLIEGVNTKAKNIIVFDNKIASNKLDFFTFNNIKGRSGRMFEHFVGNVYLFDAAPEISLPNVEFPVITQDESVPESLLVQLDDEDLEPLSKKRIKHTENNILPKTILKENTSLEPVAQYNLAQRILDDEKFELLTWEGIPTWEQLVYISELIIEILHKPYSKNAQGPASGQQLAFLINRLSQKKSVYELVELDQSNATEKYRSKSIDEAINKILLFERNWATYKFPQYLMAVSRIQAYILNKEGADFGDYKYYASQVESLFENNTLIALDEFGIPLPIAKKLECGLEHIETIDEAIKILKESTFEGDDFTAFEKDVIDDAINNM